MENFNTIKDKLPELYLNEVLSAPWEKEFVDEKIHWYSPFILWSCEDVELYQPKLDFENFFAIGSNGGMETYFIQIPEQSIWVADLIAGESSLENVASTFGELLALLKNK